MHIRLHVCENFSVKIYMYLSLCSQLEKKPNYYLTKQKKLRKNYNHYVFLFLCRHQEAESVRRGDLEPGDYSPRHQRGNSSASRSPASSFTGAISPSSPAGISQGSNSTTNTATVSVPERSLILTVYSSLRLKTSQHTANSKAVIFKEFSLSV